MDQNKNLTSSNDVSPVTLRFAEENAVDLSFVTGSGPDGLITMSDVVKFIGLDESTLSRTNSEFKQPDRDIEESSDISTSYFEIDLFKLCDYYLSKNRDESENLNLALESYFVFSCLRATGTGNIFEKECDFLISSKDFQGYIPLELGESESISFAGVFSKIESAVRKQNNFKDTNNLSTKVIFENSGGMGASNCLRSLPSYVSASIDFGLISDRVVSTKERAIAIHPILPVVFRFRESVIGIPQAHAYISEIKKTLENWK